MTTKQRQILATFLLLPTLTFAEGQWGFDYFEWTLDFIWVFALWYFATKIILSVVKKYRQKDLIIKHKYIIWALVFAFALFHLSMVTYDPHPTEGPIDSFFWKERVTNKAMADSLDAVKYLDEIAKQETEQFQSQNTAATVDSVLNLVQKLNIVKSKIKLIDSLSKGQRHISLVPTLDDTTKNIYLVKVGEDNGMNLVIYYNFLVDANSMTIINADGKLEGQ